VWKRRVNGRILTFRLIGINNQNFLMQDLETGSWWQQITGAALRGPLAGQHLEPVLHDEVTFGLWRREYPHGHVLALADEEAQIRPEWESRTATMPVVVPAKAGDRLTPRDVIIGVTIDGRAKAYPQAMLRQARAVMDRLGSTPIAMLMGADNVSTRAFDRRIDGRELELLARPGSSPARFVDAQTGSEWDISGTALSGPLAGRTLRRVPLISDYWFDWRLYHPDTLVYREWQPGTRGSPEPKSRE